MLVKKTKMLMKIKMENIKIFKEINSLKWLYLNGLRIMVYKVDCFKTIV
jgi:hypothetical protein